MSVLQPQDYLIFHPPRKGYAAQGEVGTPGPLSQWAGTVWTDPWRRAEQSNEDPFVWDAEVWLYSYCHASQLRRKPNATLQTAGPGSRLFFCETRAGKNGWLRVDTVFVVAEQAEWQKRGVVVPGSLAAHQAAGTSAIWKRHLRHGLRPWGASGPGHTGVYTYVAVTGGPSYLPLDGEGQPTSVAISAIPGLAAKVAAVLPSNQTTRPCALTAEEATLLDKHLVDASAVLVRKLTSGGPLKARTRKPAPLTPVENQVLTI